MKTTTHGSAIAAGQQRRGIEMDVAEIREMIRELRELVSLTHLDDDDRELLRKAATQLEADLND